MRPAPSETDRGGPPQGDVSRASLRVALIGNPNTGKTTLFNALTGFRRHVANYPGVTVDVGVGPVRGAARPTELLDLPGTYSLVAASPDEAIVAELLGGTGSQPPPDVIVAIADGSNLSRNLYLVSQLMEYDIPLVLVVNMVDVARGRGIEIDFDLLAQRLGVEVVPLVATRTRSTQDVTAAIDRAAAAPRESSCVPLSEPIESALRSFEAQIPSLPRAAQIRLLIDERVVDLGDSPAIAEARAALRAASAEPHRDEIQARYRWVASTLAGAVRRPVTPVVTWSDRLDWLLTHRLCGVLVLLVVLFVFFQAIFVWADPLMRQIDGAFGALAPLVAGVLPEGVWRSLIVDGLIGGVGGVLVFLPQILILFASIAVLEDCGYMARAAYMMDRAMRALGLSGKAFIPLLSSFACAVPAIMGTRTIPDRRERLTTILLAPFMSCSARLPVYILMIGAFVPPAAYLGGWVSRHGLVMMAMYLVGVLVAIPIAWLLKGSSKRASGPGFMIELPGYKVPRLRTVLQRSVSAGREFVVRAGTIILLVNVFVWGLAYFPRSATVRSNVENQAARESWDAERVEHELAGAYLRDSFLGRMGQAIEPIVRPIGWDWRIGVAVIASFPAREVVVSTLGTIYNVGEGADEESVSLREAMMRATWPGSQQRVLTLPVALSLMVFFALCAQCSSTLVVMGRETRSWRWPLLSFATMTAIAYLGALATARVAQAFGG